MADAPITYARAGNLVTSFWRDGSVRKRCLRWGSKSGARAPLDHTVQLVPPGDRAWAQAKVYVVSLSDEAREKWDKQPATDLVVAQHDGAVKSYLNSRYTKIASKWMGTAQLALTIAQSKISTRNERGPAKIGSNSRRTAESNTKTRSYGNSAQWTIVINDNLKYAKDAFKRQDAVQYATAKAANAIAGMMRKRCGDILNPALATPFPEISKMRRGA